MKVLVVSKPEQMSLSFQLIDPACTQHSYEVVSIEQVANYNNIIDFVVAIGGDGTMLTACRLAAKQNVPVVGINKGNLGFLTAHIPDVSIRYPVTNVANNYQTLSKSTRYLVKASGVEANIEMAFNEFVLSPPQSDKMLTYDLYIGNEKGVVYTGQHKANGVIIATPSGSSAYSLSCGGILVDPNGTKSLQVVPIAAFSMTSRSLLVSNQYAIKARVRIVVKASASHPVELKADGLPSALITNNKAIDFDIGPHVEVLHDPNLTWYTLLVNKLNWGQTSGRIEY